MTLRNLYRALLRLRIKVAQAEEIAARIKLARTEDRKS